MPRMKAMVPPLTPGTTSALPMQKPLATTSSDSRRLIAGVQRWLLGTTKYARWETTFYNYERRERRERGDAAGRNGAGDYLPARMPARTRKAYGLGAWQSAPPL